MPGASLNSPEPLQIIGSVTATEAPRPVRIAPVNATPIRMITHPAQHVGDAPS